MSFLAPLFLFAGFAVAGPVLLHLVRNRTREVRKFSSLMFLEQTPLRMEQQKRLENPWLLLLRILVIALLALGFSRPFMEKRRPLPVESGIRTAVLIDVSGSMRREGAWKQACEEAHSVLRGAGPADSVAVFGFDSGLREVFGFNRWEQAAVADRVELARAAIAEMSPGWDRTVLDGVLIEAAIRLSGAGDEGQICLVVISDFQEGARLDGVQGYEWPARLKMVFKPVGSREPQNGSLQWLREEGASEGAMVRVTNASGATKEQFVLNWEGPDGVVGSSKQGVPAYVPAGQSRVFRMPEQAAQVLSLTGDQEPFDNRIYRVPQEPRRMRVFVDGFAQNAGPHGLLYFLKRAFPKSPSLEVEWLDSAGGESKGADLAVLGENVSQLGLETARQLARDGRIVLVPAQSEKVGSLVAGLLGVNKVGVEESRGAEYALLAGIDYRHPLFLPFADPRYSDFSKLHFWKHRRLDFSGLESVQVAATFDDGFPAVAQVALGKGSVVVLGSSWSPQDGQFALSSKFVPFMSALLDISSGRLEARKTLTCGDSFPVPPRAEAVRCPGGRIDKVQPGGVFAGTNEPGVYEVLPLGQKFAVNLSGEESRLRPVPEDRFKALGLPLSAPDKVGSPDLAAAEKQLEAVQLEERQKVWRWLVALALGMVGVETLVAAFVAGHKMKETLP